MTEKNIAAVILAAGKGLRMKSTKPKVLHEIAGIPMIKYVLSNVETLDPKEISVVIGPGMDAVKDEVDSWGEAIKCVVQKKQLGTGDAVKQVKHLKNFKGAVLVLFGDTPFIQEFTLKEMVDELLFEDHTAVVVLGFAAQDPAEYGRLIVDNAGKLRSIVEYKDADDEQRDIDLCNAGVMAIRGELLFKLLNKLDKKNAKGEYYLTDLVKIARKEGHQCSVIEAEENEVMGINTRDQLAYAEGIIQHYLRWGAMEGGATLMAPETVYLSHDTELGQDVIIHPNVVIGPGTKIGDGVEIKPFSHIEGAEIKAGSIIGPFARIRPGTTIDEDSRVGNFVEIKNSKLGADVKAGHLSYIGDTTIGSGANIGAGTITCNYDGKKKYNTDIGAGAFIGSNTSLIAPVKIGKNAVIGAGSTITRNVKQGTTVINEMPQKELKKK